MKTVVSSRCSLKQHRQPKGPATVRPVGMIHHHMAPRTKMPSSTAINFHSNFNMLQHRSLTHHPLSPSSFAKCAPSPFHNTTLCKKRVECRTSTKLGALIPKNSHLQTRKIVHRPTSGVSRPHFDFKKIEENEHELQENCKLRGIDPNHVSKTVGLYKLWVSLSKQLSDLNHEKRVRSKMQNKESAEDLEKFVEEGKHLRTRIQMLGHQVEETYSKLISEAENIPNIYYHNSPPQEPSILRMHGTKPQFDFEPKDHLELGRILDVVDWETGARVTGQKFYFLKNGAAMLEMALTNWAFQKLIQREYEPVLAPDMIRADIAQACGYHSKADHSQNYKTEEPHSFVLAGTAEIPLSGFYAEKIGAPEEFPKKFVGFSHCFRVETGKRGQHVKGLYRVHQFSKVEMFIFATPLMSDLLFDELVSVQEEIASELGLHFKTLEMPVADLALPAYRKIDLECWMPGRNDYGEITSCSNCLDFQSRRLNARFKIPGKDPKFLHTLNGTALAVPRTILAILENFQNADGSVDVPKVLHPFLPPIYHRLEPKFPLNEK